MKEETTEHHKWLEKMVGEWDVEVTASMGPGQPEATSKGTDSVRSIGGMWVVCEGTGEGHDGTRMTSVMTLGFDAKKKRYVGTFIASMMSYLWVYEDGTLDKPGGRVLTLNAEGPDFENEGKMAMYKDVIEFINDDHRTLSSYPVGDDGKVGERFMLAHYRRKK